MLSLEESFSRKVLHVRSRGNHKLDISQIKLKLQRKSKLKWLLPQHIVSGYSD